jgi:hypothetical protein
MEKPALIVGERYSESEELSPNATCIGIPFFIRYAASRNGAYLTIFLAFQPNLGHQTHCYIF